MSKQPDLYQVTGAELAELILYTGALSRQASDLRVVAERISLMADNLEALRIKIKTKADENKTKHP